MNYDEMNRKEKPVSGQVRSEKVTEMLSEMPRQPSRKDMPAISVIRKEKRGSRKMER